MRKDIEVPQVKDVFIAAVREFNKDHRTHDWNVYLINSGNDALDTVLIVSKGFDAKDTTSTMRHKLELLPPKGFAKIEFLEESVLRLHNEFMVTFFKEGKLHDRTFTFPKHSIKEENMSELPIMQVKGVQTR